MSASKKKKNNKKKNKKNNNIKNNTNKNLNTKNTSVKNESEKNKNTNNNKSKDSNNAEKVKKVSEEKKQKEQENKDTKNKTENEKSKVEKNNKKEKIDLPKKEDSKEKKEKSTVKEDVEEKNVKKEVAKNKKDKKDNTENKANKKEEKSKNAKEDEQKEKDVEKKEKKNKKQKAEEKEHEKEKGKEEKPEYVQEMLKKKKKRAIISIFLIIIVLLIIAFSTIFALLNFNSTTITKGVTIKDVDVSNMTIDEAKEKLTEAIDTELMSDLSLVYGEEYSTTLSSTQIEFTYDIDEALNEAYDIGKTGNIFSNNYTLLFTTLFGKNIDLEYTYNEEYLDSFVDDINAQLPGVVVEPTYYIEDNVLIVEKGTDGIQIVKDEFEEDILLAFDSRTLEDVMQDGYAQTIDIIAEEVAASEIDMDEIYSEIHTEPQDAYYELDPYQIYADVDGVDLAISVEEAKEIIASEDKDEYEFDLTITEASVTIDDLGTEAFPYLISSFSTKYDASNVDRSTNLQIAAEKINGKVIMPGETFSFNKVVGKRTVEEGYKDAKIYADGGVVDGLAGGICQISSTLYNAVVLADLEIVERRNHSYTTSYVAAGRDATVVWGTTDFQFKNTRSYPIKIEASVKNGIAEFKIHGMQEETEYEISIITETTASIPYSTSYVEDATLAVGQQVVSQSGHLGYKVTAYKIKKLNGVEVSREVLSNDTYKAMTQIIRINSGAAQVIQ